MEQFRGTTIVAVKKNGKTVIAGDGQVTMGQSVILKGTAHKVRRLYDDKVVVGFAGGTADAFAMCEEFEKMLNKYSGSLMRSAVEYAKNIRNGPHGNAEAMMIVADKDTLLILTSVGDVVEPDDGVCAIGSGGNYALSAAKALIRNTDLDAREIAIKAMEIASSICVFTNNNYVVEE
ncbi:MAG TPA: ATP-dependent protease subunit HslV, partial [Candidatus Onthoplasma faecigallinarum]|nr:ATP-dependent protease subunit HslV [Candidatus Onthoplasma faecigallinarum]